MVFQYTPDASALGSSWWREVLLAIWRSAIGLCYQLTWISVSTNWSPLRVIERRNALDILGISLIPRILGFITLSGLRLLFHLSNVYLILIILVLFLGYELAIVAFGFSELSGQDFRRMGILCLGGSLISGLYTLFCFGFFIFEIYTYHTRLAFLIAGLILVSIWAEGPAGGFSSLFSLFLLGTVFNIYTDIRITFTLSLILLNGIFVYGLRRYRKWEERAVFLCLLLLLLYALLEFFSS